MQKYAPHERGPITQCLWDMGNGGGGVMGEVRGESDGGSKKRMRKHLKHSQACETKMKV